MNSKFFTILSVCSLTSSLFAGSVVLSDTNFSLTLDGVAVPAGLYEVRWGTFSAGSFAPLFSLTNTIENGAYLDAGTPELLATFSASDNVATGPFGSSLALSLSLLPDDSSYALATALNSIVLIDPLWIAGTFTLLGPELIYNFSASTTVALLTGQIPSMTTFNFNGGNELINISAIPEPSSFAAFAGLAVLGLVASRRRRSA